MLELQKARSRLEEVHSVKWKCITVPVFRRFRWNRTYSIEADQPFPSLRTNAQIIFFMFKSPGRINGRGKHEL
jgi:hypothetical protein